MPINSQEYRIKFTEEGSSRIRSEMVRNNATLKRMQSNFDALGADGRRAYDNLAKGLQSQFEGIKRQNRVLEIQTDTTKTELQKQIRLIEFRYEEEIRQARGNAKIVAALEQQKTLQVAAVNQRFQQATLASNQFSSGLAGIVSKARLLSGILAGSFAVTGIINAGRDAIRTTANFEALRTRLNALYNDAERGGEVFKRALQVAQTTHFNVQDVVEAQATLKAFGDENQNTLKIVADLAAFMNVSIPEAASAYGRAFAAGAGAADIFRERGVLTLIKTKQGIDDLTKLSLPEFRAAMTATFNDPSSGIAGATTALSQNIQGLESNLGDVFSRLQNEIGGRFADTYKDTLRELISITDSFSDSLVGGAEAAQRFQQFKIATSTQVSEIQRLRDEFLQLQAEQESGVDRQDELNKVTQEITRILPGAAAGFDEYGKTISINTDVLNAFVSAQKQVLQRTEQTAFEGLKSDISDVVLSLEQAEKQLIKTQQRIALFESPEGLEKLKQDLRDLTSGRSDFSIFTADTKNVDTLIQQANKLSQSAEESREELANLGRELSVFFDLSASADLSAIQKELGLTDEQFKRIIPSIEAYRTAFENGSANVGKKEQETINTTLKSRLDSLRLQREQLEIQTDQSRTEYERQIAIVTARYDAEIKKAGQTKQIVVELEKIKALEIEKINQDLLGKIDNLYDRQKKQADDIVEKFRQAQKDISAEPFKFLGGETEESIKRLDALLEGLKVRANDASLFNSFDKQIEKMSGDLAAFAAEYGVSIDVINQKISEIRAELEREQFFAILEQQAKQFRGVLEQTFTAAFTSGENALDAFADAFKAMLIRMAAQLAASGILGFLSGDFSPGSHGGLFGSFFKGLLGLGVGAVTGGAAAGAGGLIPVAGKSAPLSLEGGGPGFTQSPQLFLPPQENFLERRPQNVTNVININAVDAPSFEAFLRERGGAEIVLRATGEIV